MCTVTLIRHTGGLRLVTNRDEQRRRPAAEPPAVRTSGGVTSAMPIDPVAGGTWVGANQRGLAMTLLNRNDERYPARGERSRGELIPLLIDAASVDEVSSRIAATEGLQFGPFTLIALDDRSGAVWQNRPMIERVEEWSADERSPRLWTSSSLGDAAVEPARRALFEDWFADVCDPKRQNAFHAHRWADRPELSVNMSRQDAATVSTTVVELGGDAVSLAYHPGPPGAGEPAVVCRLPRVDVERV